MRRAVVSRLPSAIGLTSYHIIYTNIPSSECQSLFYKKLSLYFLYQFFSNCLPLEISKIIKQFIQGKYPRIIVIVFKVECQNISVLCYPFFHTNHRSVYSQLSAYCVCDVLYLLSDFLWFNCFKVYHLHYITPPSPCLYPPFYIFILITSPNLTCLAYV